MALVADFTTPAETFPAGRTLQKAPGLTIELERVVPTAETVVPYLWVRGDGRDTFEAEIEKDPGVTEFDVLARTAAGTLYQLEWTAAMSRTIRGLFDLEFTLLSGVGTPEGWRFEVRFPDVTAAREFHQYVTKAGIPHELARIRDFTGPDSPAHYGVTTEQREALVLAWRHGYFEEPRQTTLADLAAQLGISVSALSGRLQRGYDNLIAHTLVSTG